MDIGDIFKPQHLHWFEFGFTNDFDTLLELPQTLQGGIQKEVDQFTRQVDATIADMGEEEKGEYLEFTSDRHWELSTEYPLLMRRALLFVAYAKTEYTFHRLCDAAHLDRRTLSNPPSSVYLADSETFIKDALGITDAVFETKWTFLNSIRQIRNKFVHEDGRLPNDSQGQSLKLFISGLPDLGITLNDFDVMLLGDNSIEYIVAVSREFIGDVHSRIKALPEIPE